MADIGGFIGEGLINGLKSKQSEIVDTAKDITDSVKNEFSQWKDFGQKGIDAGFSFGESNLKQFESDIGMGGKGMLSQFLEQGVGYGTQLATQGLTQNFYTSNVDETIAVKNNQLNKQALGVVGKSG